MNPIGRIVSRSADLVASSTSAVATATLAGSALALMRRRAFFGRGPVAIGTQLAATGLMGWARVSFGWRSYLPTAEPTAEELVERGPYATVRHPVYAAVLLFLAAPLLEGDARGWGWRLVGAGSILARILAEERRLDQRYPGFEAYAADTDRVVPRVF